MAELVKDCRLSPAYALIDAHAVDVLSLDIFDTLLWRQVPEPEDLFLILGRQLKEEGWLIPAASPENFVHLRMEAEKRARLDKLSKLGTSEVTLPEIYWQMEDVFVENGISASDVSEVLKKELDLEKKLLHIDSNVLALLHYAQSKQISVVLLSNTYFDEFQIEEFLGDLGIRNHYLSCEFGCSKQEGLFDKLLEGEKIHPSRIVHIGDDYENDICPAQALGIRTVHFRKYDTAFSEVLEREWPQALDKRKCLLDFREGDFGLTAFRAKIAHHSDLKSVQKENHFYWKYGAMILGPILFGFVTWIYKRCQDMGQKYVYCLMREGKLYASLIERFAAYHPHKIEARTLWVSRPFITHAAMISANKMELNQVMNTFFGKFTVQTICTYLGLDVSKMHKWSRCQHMMLENPSIRKEFIFYLLGEKSLREQMVQHARAKRTRFLKYLETILDSSSEQMTLIDVGWRGTAQRAIHQIFQQANVPKQLYGLYLGTTSANQSDLLEGIIREGYLFNGGYPECGNAHIKGCFVLEQTATAETGFGALADIEESGQIVTLPFLIPSKQKKQAHAVQQGIFAFCDFAFSRNIPWDTESEALTTQLRAIFLRSMTNTTAEEAKKFGHWLHEHGPTTNLMQVIGKNAYYERFIKDMLPVAAFKESALNWPAAYAARHSQYLTLTSQASWLNTLPPECFLSEDKFLLKIFIDTRKEFSKTVSKQIDLRSNPNRNFFSVANLFSKRPIKQLRLLFSFPSSLVRFQSLRMQIHQKSSPDHKELIFFESEEKNYPFLCTNGRQLDFNTFSCMEHFQLIHPFEDSGIYQIQLKLCCEMFKINDSIC